MVGGTLGLFAKSKINPCDVTGRMLIECESGPRIVSEPAFCRDRDQASISLIVLQKFGGRHDPGLHLLLALGPALVVDADRSL